ncbi:MAG: lysozyme [Hyphomicrobiales bacterium]
MKTSSKGMEDIAAHEGIVLKAYRDVAGIWTIGVGHTAAAGPPKPVAGMKVSRAEAMAIFARDLRRFETRVAAALGPVPQHVFDGAVSFDFNTGAIHRASWVDAYRRGDSAEAEKRLKLWNKAGGKVVNGLSRRRAAEADLIFRGRYRAGGRASAQAATAGAIGAAAAAAAVAVASEPTTESALGNAAIIAGVVIAVAILAGVGWLVLSRGGRGKAEA